MTNKVCILTIARGDRYISLAKNLFKSNVDNFGVDFYSIGDTFEYRYQNKKLNIISDTGEFRLINKLDLILKSIKKLQDRYRYFIFLDADCVIYKPIDFRSILGKNIISTPIEQDLLKLGTRWGYADRQALEDTVDHFGLSKYPHINGGLYIVDGYFSDILAHSWYEIKSYFKKNELLFTDEEPMSILINKLKFDYTTNDDYYTQSQFITDSHAHIQDFRKANDIPRRTYFSNDFYELIETPSVIHYANRKDSILNHMNID